jgi:type III secretory pathway lipoprotein EscJ
MNSSDIPEFHPNQDAGKLSLQIASPFKRLTSNAGFWAALFIVSVIAAGGWLWFLKSKTSAEWPVVFEGRTFEKSARRQAVLQLTQIAIPHKLGPNGEILVAPADLNTAQSSLEKTGLKPTTLDELRAVNDGPLAILESPAQRLERQRAAKERELAWLIRRFDNVGQAHVTIEPVSGGRRWIGQGEKQNQPVRVFIEPGQADQRLTDETVSRIEKLVLASLPTARQGQITIHDAQTIYMMAGSTENTTEVAGLPKNPEALNRERSLSEQIRQQVSGLSHSTVRVSLKEVDETPASPSAAELKQPPQEVKPKLVLNQPIEIEVESTPNLPARQAPVKTWRARVQVMTTKLDSSETESKEQHRKAREEIAALIAPALLEQLDWQSLPETPPTEPAVTIASVKPEVEKSTKSVPAPSVRPLAENSEIAVTPWIIGGVAIALAAGGVTMWRSLRTTNDLTSESWSAGDQPLKWARDLAAAVTPPEPHSPPVDEAARAANVLSGWISANHDDDDNDSESA